jgi:hypothetical protein
MPNELEKELALKGIEELSDLHANNGCNDLVLPDSPALRQLHLEWNAWNLRTTVGKLHEADQDQIVPYPRPFENGTVCVFDSLTEFAIRKLAGLL